MKRYILLLSLLLPILVSAQSLEPKMHPKKGLYGYWSVGKNGKGSFAIKAKYEAALPFSNDRAFVSKGGLWGIIDKDGKFVLKPKYAKAELRSGEGRYVVVWQNDKCGVVDITSTKEVVPVRYDQIKYEFDISDDCNTVLARTGGKWAIVNLATANEEAGGAKYDGIKAFCAGRYLLELDGLEGVTDVKGTVLVEPKYKSICYINNDLYALYDGAWIFVNGHGAEVQIADRVLGYSMVEKFDITKHLHNNTTAENIRFTNCYYGVDGVLVFDEAPTKLENRAFSGCEIIKSVVLPTKIVSIGEFAFENCAHLTSITIPASVTSIGDGAFYSCAKLTTVALPEGIQTIGKKMFGMCGSLESITIPESVNSLGRGAFEGCAKLKSVVIPNGVTLIGTGAFTGCKSLSVVTISQNIQMIGEEAFVDCPALAELNFQGATPPMLAGNTFNADVAVKIIVPKGALLAYLASEWSDEYKRKIVLEEGFEFPASHVIEYVVNNGNPYGINSFPGLYASTYENGVGKLCFFKEVTSIPDEMFAYDNTLVSVILPDSVTSIGDAFVGCTSLQSVTYASGAQIEYSIGWK